MKASILLVITAILWGFAFVAQRAGMEFIGPFSFNAVRFALGSISLIPLLIFNKKRKFKNEKIFPKDKRKKILLAGLLAGTVLFIGASLQQIGIVYTTAGKASFITGLYLILVPIIGIFFKQKSKTLTWISALIAVVGLYLLSMNEEFIIENGDALVFVSSIFWALHVIIIGYLILKIDPIKIAFLQFFVCSFLSFAGSFIYESITIQNIYNALIPILYGGLISVGVAYTLQVVAQQYAPPSHAAIILSLESVFGLLGGWMILGETISLRGVIGCSLMLTGMILSQVSVSSKKNIEGAVSRI